MKIECPLCNRKNPQVLEVIPLKKIRSLYGKIARLRVSLPANIKEIELAECPECKLRFYTPSIVSDGDFYDRLSANSWYYMEEKQGYLYASKFINTKDKVLDIGCGNGYFAKLIASKDFTGLEINKEAAKHDKRIICQPVEEHVKTHSKQYDVVCAFQVLEHIANSKQFLNAAINCLKKGGKLIIAVPSEDSFIGEITNDILNYPPHHQTRWNDRALSRIAELNNLDLLEINHFPLDEIHYKLYLRTIFTNGMYVRFGRRRRFIDTAPFFWLAVAVSEVLARITKPGLSQKMLPFGHTVLAVYEKK